MRAQKSSRIRKGVANPEKYCTLILGIQNAPQNQVQVHESCQKVVPSKWG